MKFDLKENFEKCHNEIELEKNIDKNIDKNHQQY